MYTTASKNAISRFELAALPSDRKSFNFISSLFMREKLLK